MTDSTGILLKKHSEKNNTTTFKPYLRKQFRAPEVEIADLELMSKKEPMKLMSYVFNLPTKERTKDMVRILIKLTQDFTFFRNLVDEHFSEAHRACCINMSYAFFQAGKYVFMQGDEGNKFYIILQGTVGVQFRLQTAKDNHGYTESEIIPALSKQTTIVQDVVNEHEEVMTLTVGDSFGERALMNNQPRAASIFCKMDCHFGVLSHTDYQRILKKVIEKNFQETINLLQEQQVFKGLTRGAMQLQSYYWKLKKISKKHVLYKQGDEAKEVFIIKSGELELTREERTPIDEKRYYSPTKRSIKNKKFLTTNAKLAILGPRELIGEEEVLSNSPRLCTCTCVSDTAIVLAIQKENFERIVFRNEDRLTLLTERCSMKSDFRNKRLNSLVGVEEKKQLQQSIWTESEVTYKSNSPTKFSSYITPNPHKVPHETRNALTDRVHLKTDSEIPDIVKTTRGSFLLALDKLCVRNVPSTSISKPQSIPSTRRYIKSIYLPKPPKPYQSKPEKIVNFHTHALRQRLEGSYSSRDTPIGISSLSSLRNSSSLHNSQSHSPNPDVQYLKQRGKAFGISMVNINSFPVFQALWNTPAETDRESKYCSGSPTKCESRVSMRTLV